MAIGNCDLEALAAAAEPHTFGEIGSEPADRNVVRSGRRCRSAPAPRGAYAGSYASNRSRSPAEQGIR